MAWPNPVQPGDEVLAAQINGVLSAVQAWGGNVDARGYALMNASLASTTLPPVQKTNYVSGGTYTIPSGGTGPGFIAVSATGGPVTVQLPANPGDGETYTVMRGDSNVSATVTVDGQGKKIYSYGGSIKTTLLLYPLAAVQLVFSATFNYWALIAVSPSDWLMWTPTIAVLDGNGNPAGGTITMGTVFNNRYRVERGAVTAHWSGQLTLSAATVVYLQYTLPLAAASWLTAFTTGTGSVGGIGVSPPSTVVASVGAYQTTITVSLEPKTSLPTTQITPQFEINYPIDY